MLHLDLPTRADLDALIDHRATPSLSLYLPTTPLTQQAQGDRIAFDNLARAALAAMEARKTPRAVREEIGAALAALSADDGFWAEQANALAVFAAPGKLRVFRLANHLQPGWHLADRFHLKPLLRAFTFRSAAHVLVIGMGAVRLLAVPERGAAREVPVPGLPHDAADALGRRSHLARPAQMASGEATSEHATLTRYARVVDAALRPVLRGSDLPLLVAAAEPMASIFRAVCHHPQLAPITLPGSGDHTPDHAIEAAARGTLDALHVEELRALAARHAMLANQGRATGDLAQAARAATFGAVETLILDMDAEVPGRLDEETGKLTLGEFPDGGSVTDEIARRALRTGARVMAVRAGEVPGGGELAALLRYAF
jgi:hypothetical protein